MKSTSNGFPFSMGRLPSLEETIMWAHSVDARTVSDILHSWKNNRDSLMELKIKYDAY